MNNKNNLLFIPLGGCSEIGMNMYVYGYDDGNNIDYILVDAGVTFPNPEYNPGVDLIMPDTSFVEDNLSKVPISPSHKAELTLFAISIRSYDLAAVKIEFAFSTNSFAGYS